MGVKQSIEWSQYQSNPSSEFSQQSGPEGGSIVGCGNVIYHVTFEHVFQAKIDEREQRISWTPIETAEKRKSPQPTLRKHYSLTAYKVGWEGIEGGIKRFALLFGGVRRPLGLMADLWRLDLNTGQWALLNSGNENNHPCPRQLHAACAYGKSKLVIFGGQTLNNSKAQYLNDLWIYNYNTNTWAQVQTKGVTPEPRCRHSISVNGHNLYLVGGRGATGIVGGSVLTCDLSQAEPEWKEICPANKCLWWGEGINFVSWEHRFLVFGGGCQPSDLCPQNMLYLLDFSPHLDLARQQQQLFGTPPPPGRVGGVCVVANNKLWLIGGDDGQGKIYHMQGEVWCGLLDKLTPSWFLDEKRFKNLEHIGEGGYGDVYKATLDGSKVVAVKKAKSGLANEDLKEKTYEEYCHETHLMRELNHKNIIKFYGACLDRPNIYIVMEFVDRELHKVLTKDKNKNSVNWETKLKITLGMAEGMQYLHELEPPFLHRDMKAMNVLLDQDWNAKICDFGISCRKGTPVPNKGSKFWMSPELLQEEAPSEKSDVYAFAITMWEILTQEVTPYPNVNAGAIDNMVVNLNVRPKIDRSSLSASQLEYVALMERCWAREPADRPDFTQIIEELKKMR